MANYPPEYKVQILQFEERIDTALANGDTEEAERAVEERREFRVTRGQRWSRGKA